MRPGLAPQPGNHLILIVAPATDDRPRFRGDVDWFATLQRFLVLAAAQHSAQRTAAKDMDMQVRHFLAAVLARVEQQAIARPF
jgi:hypothetical protein